MSDSLASIDCADLRRFWKWSHANSNADPLAGLTFALGYSCVTDVCAQLNEDSGPVPLIEGTDYTVDKDAGTITFLSGGTPAFFKSNTTTVDVWFNVLVCPAAPECRSAPCCDDAGDEVYVSVRRNNCVPVPVVGFSPTSGTTQSFPLTVTLTVSRTDAVIYYTTDGSEPTADSTLYTAPFALSDCTNIVKAIGVVPGCSPGPTNVCQYVCGPPLDGMVAWYKADAITQDAGLLTSWPDSSPLGNDLTRFTSTHPTFVPSLPVVRFTAIGTVTRYYDPDGINWGGSRTGCSWLCVSRRTSVTTYPIMYTLFASKLTADGDLYEPVSGGTELVNVQGVAPDISIPINEWQVFSLTYDNAEDMQRFFTNNGTSSGHHAAGGAGQIPLDALGFQHEFGEIKEAIYYRRKLSTLELAQARNYLANKYGIAITV